jgi:hypothetical protein
VEAFLAIKFRINAKNQPNRTLLGLFVAEPEKIDTERE